jgi:imidazolonepropionase-like amidohydrolase
MMGISDRLGTIEPGNLDDLIVVEGNPLEEISPFADSLGRVQLAMVGGKSMKETGK